MNRKRVYFIALCTTAVFSAGYWFGASTKHVVSSLNSDCKDTQIAVECSTISPRPNNPIMSQVPTEQPVSMTNLPNEGIQNEAPLKTQPTVTTQAPTGQQRPVDRKKFEVMIPRITTEDEAMKLLKSIRATTTASDLSAAQPVSQMNEILMEIIGSFDGEARVTDTRDHVWGVHMDVSFRERHDGALSGRFKLEMEENGRVFSRTSGNGTPKDIRQTDDGSKAIVLDASPTVAFQVYFIPHLNEFWGNVYQRSTDGSYTPYGTVKLARR